MNCPKCNSELQTQKLHGIEVDTCPQDHGIWLDLNELDELEDEGYDEDALKGSLRFRETSTDLRCPKCLARLMQFEYRLDQLFLDYCPSEHGYWLDAGEDTRIIDLMKQRGHDMDRKTSAEADWAKTLRRLRTPSFVDKLRGLFSGRGGGPPATA